MAKRPSPASGPGGDPAAEWSPDRGGRENWALFQIIDRHFANLGISLSSPPVESEIRQAEWDTWLLGEHRVGRDSIDQLASFIAKRYRELGSSTELSNDFPFEGLGSLTKDLYRASSHDDPSPNRRFFEFVAQITQPLGWSDGTQLNQRTLAAEWGYGDAFISGLISGNRSLQIQHINRLAHSIAQAYDSVASSSSRHSLLNEFKDRYGTDNLHHLLDSLLAQAGFSVFAGGRESNLLWKQLTHRASQQDRILKVGYFWWPPLTTASTSGAVQGLAKDIVDILANLMAVQIRWIPIRWPHIHAALTSGEVDLIAPILLRLPVRMLDLALSKPIPHLLCRPNGLLSQKRRQSLLKPGRVAFLSMDDIDCRKIVWVTGKSDATTLMAKLLDRSPDIDDSMDFASIEEGWRYVLENDFDEERQKVRVFPTEHLTAAFVQRDRAAEAATRRIEPTLQNEAIDACTLLDLEHSQELGLGVCLAMPNSEPRLLEIINAGIDEIRKSYPFMRRLFYPYAKLLTSAHALSDEYLRLSAEQGTD